MKKDEAADQTDIPAGALITNPSRPFIRLLGSHSSKEEIVAAPATLRRRNDENGDPSPGDDLPPPPPPPPPVSTPDLALQLLICLDSGLNKGHYEGRRF